MEARRLRSDALENRERVLAAAVTAFLRDGQNVPLAAIAAEANVGVGTLYRRYANRAALLEDLEERAYHLVIALLTELAELDLPGIVLIEMFFDRTIAHRNQLVLPFHGAPVVLGSQSQRLREQLSDLMTALLQRGKDDGTVRDDVRTIDVVVFGAMLAQPLPNVDNWEAVAESQKQIFLRGAGFAK